MKSGDRQDTMPEAEASIEAEAAELVEGPAVESTQAEELPEVSLDEPLVSAESAATELDPPDEAAMGEPEPEAGSELEAEAEPEPEFEAEVEQEPEAEAEPDVETELEPEAEAESDVETELEPEAEAEPEPEAEAELEPEAAAESEAEVEAEPEPEAEAEPDGRAWYVVHSYSGYENKVKKNLEHRIESLAMQDKIFQVVVPTEEEIELRDGKRRTIQRRIFPGYILVEMIMDKDSWYVVRNTPGVTGFVGSGSDPTPLPQRDVDRILGRMEAEAPRIKVTFKRGQKVRINDGPFEDFVGMVDEIHADKGKLRILVSFFGRETPVELDFLQVDRI
jgi:transcriptional antiterminator NusG